MLTDRDACVIGQWTALAPPPAGWRRRPNVPSPRYVPRGARRATRPAALRGSTPCWDPRFRSLVPCDGLARSCGHAGAIDGRTAARTREESGCGRLETVRPGRVDGAASGAPRQGERGAVLGAAASSVRPIGVAPTSCASGHPLWRVHPPCAMPPTPSSGLRTTRRRGRASPPLPGPGPSSPESRGADAPTARVRLLLPAARVLRTLSRDRGDSLTALRAEQCRSVLHEPTSYSRRGPPPPDR
jgi:hypothetical protein